MAEAGPKVWLDGRLVAAGRARVSVFDRGLLHGDGLFETMRVAGAAVPLLERHLGRLFASLAALELAIPEEEAELERAVERVIDANGLEDGALRLTVTRGPLEGPPTLAPAVAPTRLLQPRPLDLPPPRRYRDGVAAILALSISAGPRQLTRHKTLNHLPSLLARREAERAGVFEALLLTPHGAVVEGSRTNLFAVFGGEAVTPSKESGALPGVGRGLVLEALAEAGVTCRRRTLRAERLGAADEIFLTSSVLGVLPVTRFEGRPVGGGYRGEITALAARAYERRLRSRPTPPAGPSPRGRSRRRGRSPAGSRRGRGRDRSPGSGR